MILGFIGLGMVGETMYEVFNEKYPTVFYDTKIEGSKINHILVSKIVFIAVPTGFNDDDTCDCSIVDAILDKLHHLHYKGIICIKSTVIPETTIQYIRKYDNPNICFCPEFLKERNAYNDFKYNQRICIVGTISDHVFDVIKKIHSHLCVEFRKVHPTEAELTKYFQNVYNTNKILFANAFYEICKSKDVEYDHIIDNLLVRKEIDATYLRCNEQMRGPSGPCLVKDTIAFNEYTKSTNCNASIFQSLVNDMKLYPKTVINGTRTEMEYYGKNL
jgi:nucleotide sugar dehydrogenase